ncbi:MAG: NTP transferase domain-containing protein [Phycisphaerales bacterium]
MLDGTTAIVLAAGRGTRMGGSKALMASPRGPWWREQAARLATVGVEAVWVVSSAVSAAMEGEGDSPARTVLADADAPMFASLLAGLRWLPPEPTGGVFVLPVDVPCPGAEVWRALAETGRVAVPVFASQRGHPVFLPLAFAAGVVRRCEACDPNAIGRLRLDEMIAAEVVEVAVADGAVVRNLNVPEDASAYFENSAAARASPRQAGER